MFEFEEMSSGFHDGFLSKYADSSGPIYDIFISDSMQDMLDIDIRSEVATVVGGGSNELASLISDLPSLDDVDPSLNEGPPSWLGGPKWSTSNDYYADVGACVNPNSVMPIISSSLLKSPKVSLNTNGLRTAVSPPLSPKENKSHLTFSPQQIKIPSLQEKRIVPQITTSLLNNRNHVETVKKDLTTELRPKEEKHLKNGILHSLAPGIGGLTFANTIDYKSLKQTSQLPSHVQVAARQVTSINQQNGNLAIKRERETSSPLNTIATMQNSNFQNLNKMHSKNIVVQNKSFSPIAITTTNSPVGSPQSSHSVVTTHTKQINNKMKVNSVSEFPKPAYSYSCLIAMALKNSRGGSLPVSEIYSFMCEHFPYFKTAPNGWKNSVRHNLSLNKCFEKIEKPATNGGQRKGCLWAMNPAKIAKMDEEVQKWSRKDPMAIRKAMVFPEHLEALERGEMKHGSTGDSDGELPSDVEEVSDSEHDQELIEDTIIQTPESFIDEDEDEQLERDFEIEVQDIYDAIDLEDENESVRLSLRQNEIIEMTDSDYQSPKRARLNVNYSIAPAGTYEQIEKSTIRQQQVHHTNQHQTQIVHHSFQQQMVVVNQQNRRKMQLVNRIA